MNALAQVTPVRSMNFVDGSWAESSSTRVVERRNPANSEDLIGIVTLSTREEARAAIRGQARIFRAN